MSNPFTLIMDPTPSGSLRNEKKRRFENVEDSSNTVSSNSDSWARFLVIEATDSLPIKLNPFAISKAISGICGDVKNVTRLRSGSLLVECARRQQSLNLLSIKTFANIEVAVSVHRTLNSCRGIIRDRARCLFDMSEEDIATELVDQGVTALKRFTVNREGTVVKTNTYLLTFARASLPQSVKAGYFDIGVDVYVPSPLRCYKCQKFGHGSNSCRGSVVCHRCGDNHEHTYCDKEYKCANCSGPHDSSSKSCPVWQTESKIMKLKCEKNISYVDAKKLFQSANSTPLPLSYSAAVTRPVMTSSVACQTDLTCVKSEKPMTSAPSLPLISKSTSASQTSSGSQSSSDSQTKTQPDTSQTLTKQSNTGQLSKKKGRKFNKKQLQNIPIPSEVPFENPFEPLDMEVSPSSQDTRRSLSHSHSRGRSPIEAP
ncbi:uncharacterized protein [Haliotis asinina]|uniref:uncharacterized protein n=1 Tax=Haliotis asinina TaxID=109174 RepID=UPI003531FD2F